MGGVLDLGSDFGFIKRTIKKGTERKFGTGEAPAFAFILGFLPREAVQIMKSEDNSDRKSKCLSQ
ncbi:hypothetical protein A3844_07110 [Paenibacillus helianthi]|uniref:Uncharacterized protein n=1 Tax=Paenibacillus helianthi TaxID=1349432 RepID=A0ABX3EVB0_9BACL|nr:hypothetical protein A3844_07110 [Paenibacillus helianthi]